MPGATDAGISVAATRPSPVPRFLARVLRPLLYSSGPQEPLAVWSHAWTKDSGYFLVRETRYRWAHLTMNDGCVLRLYRDVFKERPGLHQVRVEVVHGGGVTESIVVYGRALRDLRLVLSGVAAEVQARLSGEMGHTANLDTCIAYAEQKAAAVE